MGAAGDDDIDFDDGFGLGVVLVVPTDDDVDALDGALTTAELDAGATVTGALDCVLALVEPPPPLVLVQAAREPSAVAAAATATAVLRAPMPRA